METAVFDDNNQTSVTAEKAHPSGFKVTVGRNGERVTLGSRYRTEADALRAGNNFLFEWNRTGTRPR